MHVYVCVSVAALGLRKSNTEHAAFKSYWPSGSCKCIINSVNTDCIHGAHPPVCVCASQFTLLQSVSFPLDGNGVQVTKKLWPMACVHQMMC